EEPAEGDAGGGCGEGDGVVQEELAGGADLARQRGAQGEEYGGIAHHAHGLQRPGQLPGEEHYEAEQGGIGQQAADGVSERSEGGGGAGDDVGARDGEHGLGVEAVHQDALESIQHKRDAGGGHEGGEGIEGHGGAIRAAQRRDGIGIEGDDEGGGGAHQEEAEDGDHGEGDIGHRLKRLQRHIGAVVLQHQAGREQRGDGKDQGGGQGESDGGAPADHAVTRGLDEDPYRIDHEACYGGDLHHDDGDGQGVFPFAAALPG